MIRELQTEGTDSYRTFSTPRELGRLVRDDLAVLLSERFSAADGRSDRSASPASERSRRGPRSLPVPSTTLIGRAQDIIEVSRLLAKPDVRLVTLTGPGGIGKTRLAIAVGERLDDQYPQGTVFVPLGLVAEPELVLPHVAAVVGVTIEGLRPPWTSWSSSSRRRRPCSCWTTSSRSSASRRPSISYWPAALVSRSCHEPHRPPASSRARVPRRPAGGACVRGGSFDRGPGLLARRPAVRRSSPGSPVRLRVDRRQRARHRRDLPAPRWIAAGHRAGSGARAIVGPRCVAGSARQSPRRVGCRPGRSARTTTHPARDRRMERGTAR